MKVRVKQPFPQPFGPWPRGCRAYRSLVVDLGLPLQAIAYNGDRSLPKTSPIYWGEPGPASVFALLVCALQTAGENDNSEIGYLNEE